MPNYQNILLAVDLHPACDERITQCAFDLAKKYNSKLTILHAVEHMNAYMAAQAYGIVLEVERQLIDEAKNELNKLSEKYDIPSEQRIIETGVPKLVILEQAKKLNADLIVMGSHGRHGISLLLGSTANGVIHHAQCDVFVVRVKEE